MSPIIFHVLSTQKPAVGKLEYKKMWQEFKMFLANVFSTVVSEASEGHKQL